MTKEIGLWVERYRPKTVEAAVLPPRIKGEVLKHLGGGDIPNMIFEGPPGCGKTTVARAVAEQLGASWIIVNGSEDSGIDVIRTHVRRFASTLDIVKGSNLKVVIFDEADYLNPNSSQPALRAFIEEFAPTTRFIFTCNYRNKIIPALHSRCALVSFALQPDERPKMAAEFFKVCGKMLTENGVAFEPDVLAAVVKLHFPDLRRVINELQRYSVAGKIDSGILSGGSANVDALVDMMREKNFTGVRKFCAENADVSTAEFFSSLYKSLSARLSAQSIPGAVLTIADYQYKAAFAVNQEINMTACCVALMSECVFN